MAWQSGIGPILIFDLDGTIVDSLGDIGAALNRLLGAHGLAALGIAEVAALVGDGSSRLVERAFAARGQTADAAAVAAFLADYTAHAAVSTRPYPGAVATLGALKAEGWRLGLCTNKSRKATESLLKALELAPFFAALGAGDSFPFRKPDPRHLLATIAAVSAGAPAPTLMVGDHGNDLAAATGAGVPAIFAAWGYGGAAAGDWAAVARCFADLIELAPRLISRG